ncbi:exodeoxyribonuclease VII small subunit, partial [bacterium]|nr:exodeoxyribonuclease VII small subunit [bacterium]
MSKTKPIFENELERLEKLVDRLENGELGLEESLKAFEEGTKLAKSLTKILDEAQMRVQKLSGDGQGEFHLDDFGDD